MAHRFVGSWGMGALTLTIACAGGNAPEPSLRQEVAEEEADGLMDAPERFAKIALDRSEGEAAATGGSPGAPSPQGAPTPASAPVAAKPEAPPPPPPPGAPAAAEQGPTVRTWFPEAFLWAPRVETDDRGAAVVDVRVPDQLTTWRVLGLAHDRGGEQAGALASFDSRLPVYVDPVVPGWLYAGDVIELPVQAVNGTDAAVSATLTVTAGGAVRGGGGGPVPLGPGASDVRRVRLETAGAGRGTVRAELRADPVDGDAAERELPVFPSGRPVVTAVGGSLSSARALSLAGPEGADPATQELVVRVFPGPLALLQSEMERLDTAPVDGAYGFALASSAATLSARVGVEVDAKVARRLQLVAWQRVAREARAPDAGIAADLLGALNGVTGHELAEQLRPRLVSVLVQGQRGDGTWARQPNASLQRVIVQTAVAARALPGDQVGARLRATGAIERYAREITDPYTASVVLAAGLADDDARERLLSLVRAALVDGSDGARTLAAPADAVENAWGLRPSRAEVLAWGALALAGEPAAADLVAELASRWDARWGFGAGKADVVALEAIATLLPGADALLEVSLLRDGVVVATAPVDPKQIKVPAVLTAPGGPGAWELRTSREAPGLAWVGTLSSWVPWTGRESLPGVEIEVAAGPWRVGQDGELTLTVSAPSGAVVTLEQGLPAGASVDEAALASLPGVVDRQVETDRVRLTTRPFSAGEVLELTVTVRPAFAGRFQTVPLTVEVAGRRVELAPQVWTVGG